MALKNRDGTAYRLAGPIPFMREQAMWENYQLHNFRFKGVTVEDKGPLQIAQEARLGFVEELADLTRADEEFVAEPVVDVKLEEPLPPVAETKVQQPPTAVSSMLKHSPNKVTVYCLPGTMKKMKDDLYGEVRSQVVYGDPFVFEGVVLYGDDTSLSLWCPTDQIGKGSILYPQNAEKRWWRVMAVEPNMQGWMLHTTISDYQPQFRL